MRFLDPVPKDIDKILKNALQTANMANMSVDISQGMDDQTISAITQLSIDDIAKLR